MSHNCAKRDTQKRDIGSLYLMKLEFQSSSIVGTVFLKILYTKNLPTPFGHQSLMHHGNILDFGTI